MRRRSALKNKQKLLATPYFFWAVAFIIIPILMVFYYGFIDSAGHFTMQNILAIASPEHSKALFLGQYTYLSAACLSARHDTGK